MTDEGGGEEEEAEREIEFSPTRHFPILAPIRARERDKIKFSAYPLTSLPGDAQLSGLNERGGKGGESWPVATVVKRGGGGRRGRDISFLPPPSPLTPLSHPPNSSSD